METMINDIGHIKVAAPNSCVKLLGHHAKLKILVITFHSVVTMVAWCLAGSSYSRFSTYFTYCNIVIFLSNITFAGYLGNNGYLQTWHMYGWTV